VCRTARPQMESGIPRHKWEDWLHTLESWSWLGGAFKYAAGGLSQRVCSALMCEFAFLPTITKERMQLWNEQLLAV
jgi:hypothetical protein